MSTGRKAPPARRRRAREEDSDDEGRPASRRRQNPESSPPPAFDEELVRCLKAFGSAKKLSEDAVAIAIARLDADEYTPETLGGPDITVQRVQELSRFKEGKAAELKTFARKWCMKMDGKRARRGLEARA